MPKDHLAHVVSETIDALELSAFDKRYEGGGARNQPCHPAMMVKVLVLISMTEAVKDNTGQTPEVALADGGYRSGATLANLSEPGIKVFVAVWPG